MSAEFVREDMPNTLAALVAEIRRLNAEAAANVWRMGKCLGKLYRGALWKSAIHTTWDLFARDKLDLTGHYAWRLIAVAEHFTEAEVRACGTAKLVKILPLPKAERPKFVELAKRAPLREVRAAVNRRQLERAKEHPAGIVQARDSDSKYARKTHKVITHIDGGERLVELFSPNRGGRAKSLADKPMGRLLLGGRAYVVQVRSTPNGLVLGVKAAPDE